MAVRAGTVAVYLRISKDTANLSAGVNRQRVDCRAIASARWPDAEIVEYVDNDISASRYSRRTRTAFAAMCTAIASGDVIGVVSWDMDRLFRQPRELESFVDLCESAHMTSVVTAQGDLDLSTHDGRFRARILAAVAAKESDDKSRRIRRANQDRRERGQHQGSRVVFGYRLVDRVPVVVPEHAVAVRDAATRALAGESLQSIARHLRATSPDSPHTGAGVRQMLLSPTHVARTTTGERGAWPAILTDEQHADLHARFHDPERIRNAPSGARRWWLSGLLVCGVCDGPLRVKRDSSGGWSWACVLPDGRGRGCVAIRAVPTTAEMELRLFEAVEVERAAPPSPFPPAPDTDRLAELARMYAQGELTRGEWVAARDAVQHTQTETTPANAGTRVAIPDDIRRIWPTWTADEQHAHARGLIEQVRIMPWERGGGKWQPARIRVTWRK